MKRPKIIIHILSALDGKIAGPFMGTPSAGAVSGEYGRIRGEYQADAWLYGTVTTKEFTGYRKPELDGKAVPAPDNDFIAEKKRGPLLRFGGRLWGNRLGIRDIPKARTAGRPRH